MMFRDPAFAHFLNDCRKLVAQTQKTRWIENAFHLFEENSTVPFIARYRKERIGEISASELYELQRKWKDFNAMIKLRDSKLGILESNGKISNEIREEFMNCTTKEDVEELYSAYKETKTAKSTVIENINVDSVAENILTGNISQYIIDLATYTAAKSTKYTVSEALTYLCTSHLCKDSDIKTYAKQLFEKYSAIISTSVTKECKPYLDSTVKVHKSESSTISYKEFCKYKDYHAIDKRKLFSFEPHGILALRRGKEAGVIQLTISTDEITKRNLAGYIAKLYKCKNPLLDDNVQTKINKNETVGSKIYRNDIMSCAVKEAVTKISSTFAHKQWKDAIVNAELEAANVFSTSLRALLLTAPLRKVLDKDRDSMIYENDSKIVVLAVDPGYSHGHKWVVLESGSVVKDTGANNTESRVVAFGKVFMSRSNTNQQEHHHHKDQSSSFQIITNSIELKALIERFNVNIIAIGNGTGTRDAQKLVSETLEHIKSESNGDSSAKPVGTKRKLETLETGGRKHGTCRGYVVVSESGASIYSSLDKAKEEFPSLDISFLGAISIGRRLMDPLSELVKIPPQSLGVGMYQHDLSDKGIAERLRNVVEDCVNLVGVDVNTASADLLGYISGLTDANVRDILAYRNSSIVTAGKSKKTVGGGSFKCLDDLRLVKGIGPKTFQNCAGFLRVYNGSDPLDATNVHPEDYATAKILLKLVNSVSGRKMSSSEMKPKQKQAKLSHIDSDVTKNTENDSSVDSLDALLNESDDVLRRKISVEEIGKLRSIPKEHLQQLWHWLDDGGLIIHDSQHQQQSKLAPYTSLPKVFDTLPEDFIRPLEVGSVVSGVIRNVTTFGAFVDLGGVEIKNSNKNHSGHNILLDSCDGLLHISKYKHVNSSEIYVGRSVKVKINSIEDPENMFGKEDRSSSAKSVGHGKHLRIGLDLVDLL